MTSADHNTLRWVDDNPFVYNDPSYYQPWSLGEPNGRSLSCVRLRVDRFYTWAAFTCSANQWALCKTGKCSNKTKTVGFYYF